MSFSDYFYHSWTLAEPDSDFDFILDDLDTHGFVTIQVSDPAYCFGPDLQPGVITNWVADLRMKNTPFGPPPEGEEFKFLNIAKVPSGLKYL